MAAHCSLYLAANMPPFLSKRGFYCHIFGWKPPLESLYCCQVSNEGRQCFTHFYRVFHLNFHLYFITFTNLNLFASIFSHVMSFLPSLLIPFSYLSLYLHFFCGFACLITLNPFTCVSSDFLCRSRLSSACYVILSSWICTCSSVKRLCQLCFKSVVWLKFCFWLKWNKHLFLDWKVRLKLFISVRTNKLKNDSLNHFV